MKTGLILEGGAMRGLFTAGVLDVLMEHGVSFDGMVGVSAGAAFGSNFKSGQIGHISHKPQKLEQVYALGRAAGERRLAEIQAFLAPSACTI